MKLLRVGLLVCVFAFLGYTQPIPSRDANFTVYVNTTSGANILTLQHTVHTSKNSILQFGYVYCATACSVTLEVNGTAATATAATLTNINPNSRLVQTSTCDAYSASNVGTSTVLMSYSLVAGSSLSLNLSSMILPSGVASNVTLRTSALTGASTVGFGEMEQ